MNNKALLSKFKDSEVRYNKSTLFRITIERISRWADLYEIIDELIEIVNKTQEEFDKYIETDVRPLQISISKEDLIKYGL